FESRLLELILGDPLLGGGPGADGAGPARAVAPLPLLEFALERLWLKAVDRGGHEFTRADYDGLGGLGGAIAGHAEEVYHALPTRGELGADSPKLAERIFKGLVGAGNTRRPRARADLETETGAAAAAHKVIDYLVGERLLTIRSDPNNLTLAQVE